MFEAEITDRLPELADYEDYLTSCVFGALKYLPTSKGLLPVLAAARNHRLDISRGAYCERESIDLSAISEAQFVFWPRCSQPRPSEPDLAVILQGKPHFFVVPIEVKYFGESTARRKMTSSYGATRSRGPPGREKRSARTGFSGSRGSFLR